MKHYNLQAIIAVGFKVNNDCAKIPQMDGSDCQGLHNSGLDDGQRASEKRAYFHR